MRAHCGGNDRPGRSARFCVSDRTEPVLEGESERQELVCVELAPAVALVGPLDGRDARLGEALTEQPLQT